VTFDMSGRAGFVMLALGRKQAASAMTDGAGSHSRRRRGGGRGARAPLKFRGKYFSGNYYVKFGHFSGKNHVEFGNFVNFSEKVL